jgi:Flp pilus assembly pilin Flp
MSITQESNIIQESDSTIDLHDDAGQATVEYALVLLGAALIALLLIGWATVGGGAARIGQFLGHVFDVIEKKVV